MNSHHQRPSSTYYEYETLHYNGGVGQFNPNITIATSTFNHGHALNGSHRRTSGGSQGPYKNRLPHTPNNSSIRSRGPFVTHVTIREPNVSKLAHSATPTNIITSASKV